MLGGAIEEVLLPAAKLEIAVSGTLIGEKDIYLACKFHVWHSLRFEMWEGFARFTLGPVLRQSRTDWQW